MSNTVSNQYSFVSAEEDVDYDRILRETPRGTLFILVEERTRDNQAKDWSLFVHNKVLSDPRVQGVSLGDTGAYKEVRTVSPTWGWDEMGETKLHSYRMADIGPDAIPGYVRKTIDYIKRTLNPKDTRTVVTLF